MDTLKTDTLSLGEINNIVYNKKWTTRENFNYKMKFYQFIYHRAPYRNRVPDSWAREVYELLVKIDKKYGIKYATHGFRRGKRPANWSERISLFLKNTKAVVYNFLFKGKVEISQIKEKYGYLIVSYTADESVKSDVETDISVCKIYLKLKGVYPREAK